MKRQTKRYTLRSLLREPNKPSRRQFPAQSGKVVAGPGRFAGPLSGAGSR